MLFVENSAATPLERNNMSKEHQPHYNAPIDGSNWTINCYLEKFFGMPSQTTTIIRPMVVNPNISPEEERYLSEVRFALMQLQGMPDALQEMYNYAQSTIGQQPLNMPEYAQSTTKIEQPTTFVQKLHQGFQYVKENLTNWFNH